MAAEDVRHIPPGDKTPSHSAYVSKTLTLRKAQKHPNHCIENKIKGSYVFCRLSPGQNFSSSIKICVVKTVNHHLVRSSLYYWSIKAQLELRLAPSCIN